MDGQLNKIINKFICGLSNVHFSDEKLWYLLDGRYTLLEPALKKYLLEKNPSFYWKICTRLTNRLYDLCKKNCLEIDIPVHSNHYKHTKKCHKTGKIYTIKIIDGIFNVKFKNLSKILYDDLKPTNMKYMFIDEFENLTRIQNIYHKQLRLAEPESVENIVDVALFLFCPIDVDEINNLISDYVPPYVKDNELDIVICGWSYDKNNVPFLLPG